MSGPMPYVVEGQGLWMSSAFSRAVMLVHVMYRWYISKQSCFAVELEHAPLYVNEHGCTVHQ